MILRRTVEVWYTPLGVGPGWSWWLFCLGFGQRKDTRESSVKKNRRTFGVTIGVFRSNTLIIKSMDTLHLHTVVVKTVGLV